MCQLWSQRPSYKEECMTHCIFLQVLLALRNVNSAHTCPEWTEAAPSRGVSSSLPLDASAKAVCGGVDWRLPCYRVSVWLYPAAEMNNMMSVQPSVSDKQCACQFIVRQCEFFLWVVVCVLGNRFIATVFWKENTLSCLSIFLMLLDLQFWKNNSVLRAVKCKCGEPGL